jgi:hypothetical protein
MLSRSLKIMPSLRLKMFDNTVMSGNYIQSPQLHKLNLSSRKRSFVSSMVQCRITTCEYINNINEYTTIAQTQYRKFVYNFFS